MRVHPQGENHRENPERFLPALPEALQANQRQEQEDVTEELGPQVDANDQQREHYNASRKSGLRVAGAQI